MANLDGRGYSLSAQALQAAGVQPGSAITAGGETFTWPSGAPGFMNNVYANSQTVVPATPQNASALVVLGTGTSGPASGSGTVFYTDGSIQPFTLTFSDWTLNGSKTATLVAGNTIAIRMSYRDDPNGKRNNITTYVFSTSIPLQAGHTVQRIVLPASSTGQLHIFGLALTGTANAAVSSAHVMQTTSTAAYTKTTTQNKNRKK